jgi:Transmembrane exosortase (Exosortase_EpsH)
MVILGGLGLLFGLVSSVPAASTFFLCIMIFGACLALAGPFLLRVVLTPLLYLLLMIPFPSSVIQALVVRFQLTGAAMLGGALELLSTKNRVLGPEVTMQSTGYPLTVSPSLSGVGTFFFAITATLAYLLWRRSSFGRGLVALIITAFISCLVSVLRLLILGEVASSNPSMADLLGKIPALPAILIVWALTWLFTRKLLSPRPKVQPEVAA